jgi:hypothetical protein
LTATRPWLGLLLVLLVGALPLPAVLRGAEGPLVLDLNLGPGDGPYVSNFRAGYEIDDGVAMQWTTRASAISLPLTVEGGPVTLAYRFGPPPLDAGRPQVGIELDGSPVERFLLTERAFQERRVRFASLQATPLEIQIHVAHQGPRDLGLRLDWLRIEVERGGRVFLDGAARWRAPALLVVLGLLLVLAGWPGALAAAAVAPFSLAALLVLRRDPWLAHRLLTGVPEALCAFGLLVVVGGRLLLRRKAAAPGDVRVVSLLLLAGFTVRALALNTPGFYHPDFRSHVQLALLVRKAGLDFLLRPSVYLPTLGVWSKPAFGGTAAFPYSPAFHLPFAATTLGYDALITAMKLAAAAISTLPVALLWALARRLGASVLGAGLLLALPIYGRHLAVAYMPALFGHAVDLAFVLWLAVRIERPLGPREWWTAAGFVAACELAYVSAVTSLPAFVAALALVAAVRANEGKVRRLVSILAFGVAGSAVAVLAYYRDFLGLVLDAARMLASGWTPASGAARPGLVGAALSITGARFDPAFLALALVGLGLLFRRSRGRVLLAAWLLSYALLLAGRAWLPDLFQHQHEALWLAPLLALAAGETLARVASGPSWRRALAAVLFLALAGYGLWVQAHDLAGQMAYAR